MIIKMKVENSDKKYQGLLSLFLDMKNKIWNVQSNQNQVLQKISLSEKGTLELKDWGVIWLLDEMRKNRLIIRDAPKNAVEFFQSNGTVRIYDPVSHSLKDVVIKWEIDSTAMYKIKTSKQNPLNPMRRKLLADLNRRFPCTYKDKNFDILTGRLRKQSKNYTSCGSLPGYVAAKLWEFKHGRKADKHVLQRISLSGTNNVRIRGKRFGAWIEADLVKRPKPGDIYALLDYGKSNRDKDNIGHVGVVESANGAEWRTTDLGQGRMTKNSEEGRKNVYRKYNEATGELTGEILQGGGVRVVAGWVDIDKYLAAI